MYTCVLLVIKPNFSAGVDLDDLIVYRRAMTLAQSVWTEVKSWPRFARWTVGEQLVRSADSVCANISEGHGRYHYGERRQFCYYGRGSLQETLTWIRKAQMRKLMDEEKAKMLTEQTIEVRRMLNGYIRSLESHTSYLFPLHSLITHNP